VHRRGEQCHDLHLDDHAVDCRCRLPGNTDAWRTPLRRVPEVATAPTGSLPVERLFARQDGDRGCGCSASTRD
jgi:hypothetical protein